MGERREVGKNEDYFIREKGMKREGGSEGDRETGIRGIRDGRGGEIFPMRREE